MAPVFFASPAEWRKWLEKHHNDQKEILVGFYKRDSGKPSITWPESVDAALCFGWIDGVRRRIDDVSYSIRFTPRKSHSIWSVVNIKRVAELTREGLMQPTGQKAFDARKEARSGIYAFEQKEVAFEPTQRKQFQNNEAAWNFFRKTSPTYQKTATWWVVSAKRKETKAKRLQQLMEASEQEQLLSRFVSRPKGN
jgi:uncharacterized protein YdeI (YjbR/CyaY-like superfamily)